MSDLSPTHLDDEALSAVLDDAATEAESRHVEGCATCAARLGSLRAVAAAVGSPVPAIAPDRLDAAVAAALSAQNVIPISVARSARRPPAWLGAAAGIAAVLGVAGLITGADGAGRDGADEVATGGVEAVEEASDDMVTMEASEPAADAPSATGSAPASGLGELRGVELRTLVDEAAARTAQPAPVAGGDEDAAGGSAGAPCEGALRAGDPDLGAVTFVGDGTWDGEPVVLVVFEAGSQRRAFVAASDGCAVRSTAVWEI